MPKSLSIEQLHAALTAQGVLAQNAETPPADVHVRPWYIDVVLGFSAWLAGCFALVFIAILFKPDTASEFATGGCLLLAAAFGLYKVDRESAFVDQLALAFSVAGQCLLAAALIDKNYSAAACAGLIALLQCAVFIAMPNRLARLLAALFASIAWALAIRFAWWGENSYWDGNRTSVAFGPALLGWLVVWVPIAVGVRMLLVTEPRWLARGWHVFARPAMTGLMLGLTLGTFVSQPIATFTFWMPEGQQHSNWLVLWPLLAVAATCFVILCAWQLRSRAMLGVGIAAALLHVMHFYFLLGTTLLIKSCIMLGLGALLLLVARLLQTSQVTSAPR